MGGVRLCCSLAHPPHTLACFHVSFLNPCPYSPHSVEVGGRQLQDALHRTLNQSADTPALTYTSRTHTYPSLHPVWRWAAGGCRTRCSRWRLSPRCGRYWRALRSTLRG